MKNNISQLKDTIVLNTLLYIEDEHSTHSDKAKESLKEFADYYGFAIKRAKSEEKESERLKNFKKLNKKKKLMPVKYVYEILKEFIKNEKGYAVTAPTLYASL